MTNERGQLGHQRVDFPYAELLNLGRFEEVGRLFEHGRIVVGENFSVEGADAVGGMLRREVTLGEEVPDTLIITSNLQIDVDGDLATSKAYITAMHQMNGAIVPVVAGRYHDRFRRIDGAWFSSSEGCSPISSAICRLISITVWTRDKRSSEWRCDDWAEVDSRCPLSPSVR